MDSNSECDYVTGLHRKGYPTILIFRGVLVSDEPLRSVNFSRKDMCDVSEISIYPCRMSASMASIVPKMTEREITGRNYFTNWINSKRINV